ncbi:hypothetical protein Aple_087430 [Acrocarpospora pleiomorpha]|uniref:Lipoprotein n=1 Tax=Acrocarpospora pleiomorpha TaxID=90975 RepID=A0A5M3XXG0_9ACTN|nr:hypothetical protein [Acrocarpospora pleiomorpha]GES25844.1 hypothetical protein Aple_087430 [Acrocarpospora pleiomorpha]
MKRLAILAVAAASVVVAYPAQAQDTDATARYAVLKSCPKKDYRVPCGPWTITRRDGKQFVLADAQVFQVWVNGKNSTEVSLPITLSGDGQRVVYFRKSDRRLVVRDLTTDKVFTLPSKVAQVPKGLTMGDIGTFLSKDGTLLAVDYLADTAKRPSWIVEVDTGTVSTVKGNASVESISPGGKYLLASEYTNENTLKYIAYDTTGNVANSQVVPQVISNNAPVALADDGATVAVIVNSATGKKYLRTYDLAQDTLGERIKAAIPDTESVQRALWDTSDRLSVWTFHDAETYTATLTTSWHLDAGTGEAKKTDSFKIKSMVWDYRLPGG